MHKATCRHAFVLVLLTPLAGCFGPNYERIANALRDENVQLKQQASTAAQSLKNKEATIAQLNSNTPRVPTLPADRLAVLYTTDHVKITGVLVNPDDNRNRPAHSFRVMFRPLSVEEYVLPATGTATLEAFDLSIKDGDNRLGKWTFTPEQLKANWYGSLGLNHFAVDCPWTQPPKGTDITFKLTFTDALTGGTVTDQRVMPIPHPPATRP